MSKKEVLNFILFPVRIVLNHDAVEKLGLVSLRQERVNICKKYIRGKVLDIGCGSNKLIQTYRNGVGIAPVFSSEIDICADGMNLPFAEKVFDTVTFMVSLRYITDRVGALKEVNRVLKDNGLVLILENNPIQNFLRHKITWWLAVKGEKTIGLTRKEILFLLERAGFKFEKLTHYLYGLGRLYIGRKIE